MKFSEAVQAVVDSAGRKGMRLPEWKEGTFFFASVHTDKVDGTSVPCMFLACKRYSKGTRAFINPRYPFIVTWEVVDIEADQKGRLTRKNTKQQPPMDLPPWI